MVALHGRISEVVCLDCGGTTRAAGDAARLTEANPGWLEEHAAVAARPDGDVELEETDPVRRTRPAAAAAGG